MNKVVTSFAAVAALALSASAAFAQTSTPPPAKPGIFSRLFHPKPKPGTAMPMHSGAMPYNSTLGGHPGMMGGHSMTGGSMMGGRSGMTSGMMGGQYIGNKNSHVYHMPGDTGSLPAPQNRVYFRSAAAAEAAGYHAAGGSHTMSGHRIMPNGGPMMQH